MGNENILNFQNKVADLIEEHKNLDGVTPVTIVGSLAWIAHDVMHGRFNDPSFPVIDPRRLQS